MTRLTPVGYMLKWVIAPLFVALIGFFLIGPRLGDDALSKLKVPEQINQLVNRDSKPDGPTVDVSVSPADRR